MTRHVRGVFGGVNLRGLGSGVDRNHNGEYICPNCGHHKLHQISFPCNSRNCPICNKPGPVLESDITRMAGAEA